MQKWQYGHAVYANGLLTPHVDEMQDVTATPQSVGHFLQEAGAKGWELCATLPYPGETSAEALAVIFKRPA